jgi:hypothetical protein
MTIKLSGYQPDADKYSAGVILAGNNIEPTTEGMRSSKTFVNMSEVEQLTPPVVSVKSLPMLTATQRTFIGTGVTVEELISSSMTTRFTHTSTASTVSFANIGDISLMANNVNKIAAAPLVSSFTEITDAPIAKVIVENGGYILAFNYRNDSDTIPDGWWSSDLYNYTVWNPLPANLASNGRLTESSGEIVTAISFNDRVLAFKNGSTYVGVFTDTISKWTWAILDETIGCVGIDAITNTPLGVIWVSNNDINLYDSNRVSSIGAGVKYWFQRNINSAFIHKTSVVYDSTNKNVIISFCSKSSSGELDKSLVFRIEDGRWGIMGEGSFPSSVTAAVIFEHVLGDTTIDDVSTPIDSLTETFDSLAFKGGQKVLGAFSTDGNLYTLTGLPSASWFMLNVNGQSNRYLNIHAVTPIWLTKPTTSYAKLFYSDFPGPDMLSAGQANQFLGRYNFHKRARYHQITIYTEGDFTIYDIEYNFSNGGNR